VRAWQEFRALWERSLAGAPKLRGEESRCDVRLLRAPRTPSGCGESRGTGSGGLRTANAVLQPPANFRHPEGMPHARDSREACERVVSHCALVRDEGPGRIPHSIGTLSRWSPQTRGKRIALRCQAAPRSSHPFRVPHQSKYFGSYCTPDLFKNSFSSSRKDIER
jgi:hypothetical protein